MSWPKIFLSFDLLRGLHIIAVIAWMSGMMYLPRLYAYHTATAPPGGGFDAHFKVWEGKLLKIIINPSMAPNLDPGRQPDPLARLRGQGEAGRS